MFIASSAIVTPQLNQKLKPRADQCFANTLSKGKTKPILKNKIPLFNKFYLAKDISFFVGGLCSLCLKQSPLFIQEQSPMFATYLIRQIRHFFIYLLESFEKTSAVHLNKLLKSDSDLIDYFFELQHKNNRTLIEHCN